MFYRHLLQDNRADLKEWLLRIYRVSLTPGRGHPRSDTLQRFYKKNVIGFKCCLSFLFILVLSHNLLQ